MVLMDIASRLENLVGKLCIYKVSGGPEISCTVLSIKPPTKLHAETLFDEMQAAINQSPGRARDYAVNFHPRARAFAVRALGLQAA
jgi:hypothetical protein